MDVNPVAFAKALADETRQEIMQHLCCVWLSVDDLVEKLNQGKPDDQSRKSQPTVSHHLKILKEAELVYIRKEGKYRYYTLNQEMLTTCCGVLVRNFAPDYTQNLVSVDAIPVVGPSD